jgi:CRP-like cAMP-binding protein
MSVSLWGLPSSTVEGILQASCVKTYEAGAIIFEENDRADYCFHVLDGWLKLERLKPSGRIASLGLLTRNETVGETAALLGERYPFRGYVCAKMSAIRIPAQILRHAFIESPEIRMAVMTAMAHHAHQLTEQIEQQASRSGAEMVAEYLLSLTKTSKGPAVLALPFSKHQIANWIGMWPENLSHCFARLRGLGVKVLGTTVFISDVQSLSERLRTGAIRTTRTSRRTTPPIAARQSRLSKFQHAAGAADAIALARHALTSRQNHLRENVALPAALDCRITRPEP